MLPVTILCTVVILAAVSSASLTNSVDDVQSNFVPEKRSNTDFLQFLFMEERKARQSLEKTVEDLGQMMQDLQRTVTRMAEQSQDEDDGTCPMGFSPYGSKCYRVFEVQSSWIEAKMYCRVLGGDLAVIDRKATHDYLKQLINRGPKGVVGYWLDGSDLPYMNKWYWIGKNDKEYRQFAYHNWHPHEPNDNLAYSTCMGMWRSHDWLWHDYLCSDRRQGFICQA